MNREVNPFSDVEFVKDMSGRSGALTWLVKDINGNCFVRKWATGAVGEKLRSQAQFYIDEVSSIPCPEVRSVGTLLENYYIDLEYIENSDSLLESCENGSASNIKTQVFQVIDLIKKFHVKPEMDVESRLKYFELKLIQSAKYAYQFLKCVQNSVGREIVINGIQIPELDVFWGSRRIQLLLSKAAQEKVSKRGHGDLTLSNILISPKGLCFIDPNLHVTGVSQCQEFSKLLQSSLLQIDRSFSRYEVFAKKTFELSYNPHLGLFQLAKDIQSKLDEVNCEAVLTDLHLAIHAIRLFPYIKKEDKESQMKCACLILLMLNSLMNERSSKESLLTLISP